MTLNKLQEAWVRHYTDLAKVPEFRDIFAFPFISVAPPGYNPDQFPSLLYVGRATAGGWEEQECTSVDDRRRETQEFMSGTVIPGKGGSAFWYLAKRLVDILAEKSPISPAPYQNFVWTEIAKIGVVKGNPEGIFFDVQRDLAIQTLEAELSTYRPRLVVFATGGYQKSVVHTVTVPERDWRRESEEKGYWWIPASIDGPALLWTDHPQGKSANLLDAWCEKARNLVHR